MKLINTIKYEEVKFKWISSHYDLHLNGTCIYKNELHEFQTLMDWENWDADVVCQIYQLTTKEKLRRLFRQKMFEIMVGEHWTVGKNKQFHIRKPKWLYKGLLSLYYKFK